MSKPVAANLIRRAAFFPGPAVNRCLQTRVSRCTWGLLLGIWLSVAVWLPAPASARDAQSLELSVPSSPRPRQTPEGIELVYEVHLANRTPDELRPTQVDVIDESSGGVVQSYSGEKLDRHLDLSGIQHSRSEVGAIDPGKHAVLFVDALIRGRTAAVVSLRVTYQRPGGDSRVVQGGDARVEASQAPDLRPPLRGGPWVAVYDPSWERGHRRVAYSTNGRLTIPGRFAVDWVMLDRHGHQAIPHATRAAEAFAYGQPVLAVGAGTVVRLRDDAPERSRLTDPVRDGEGNHVTLALSDGRFAHYGHLRPGSAKVVLGGRIEAGDVIAEVGFSGTASDPQLHFAVTDGPDEPASEGLPFEFDLYEEIGQFDDVAHMGSRKWTHARRAKVVSAAPLSMSVVRFPPRVQ